MSTSKRNNQSLIWKKIVGDSQSTPNFLDLDIVEHHHVQTQISNILISLAECAHRKTMPQMAIDEISTDIFLFINQIKLITEDRLYIRVYKWVKAKLKIYEAYANSFEEYEVSHNLYRVQENMNLIKTMSNNDRP